MRYAAPASLALSFLLSTTACGGAAPSDATVYYDPALRPGVVEATEAERAMLDRLGEVAPGATVEADGRSYLAEAAYHAASGRRCRALRSASGSRLAYETEEGWVFVPAVLAEVSP